MLEHQGFDPLQRRLGLALEGAALALASELAAFPEFGVFALPPALAEAGSFRVIFFILTFFSIGLLSNFRTLWSQGIGKLAAVYVLSLFGFIIWVGLLGRYVFPV
ncbi:hypothetical protein [Magnetospirillum sp. 15-1]|uniref:hypothetical protein n=1 Tax=Magnetospirillum sp. 15-1 TaxID=1979370 RepID=UPI0018D588BB|nr:hypothetical protein [Magnetospirillum sp. 15-1]